MRIRTVCFILAFLTLIISPGMSQYLVTESFNYANGAKPDTLLGETGNGFVGSWDRVDGTADLTTVVDTGLAYVDLAYTIPHVGKNAQVNNPGAWTAARYQRALATTWPDVAGAEYWLSLIFEAKATPTGNTYYIVKLYGNSTEVLAVGKGGGGTAYTCGSGWPGGGSADRSAFECTGAEPVWLVTRIVMSGDGNDERTFMWVNPDPSLEPDTSIADVKRNSTMDDGIDMIGLECGGEVAMETHWDEIRLGTSFTDVSKELSEYYAIESFGYEVGSKPDTLLGSTANGFLGSWDRVDGTADLTTVVDTGLAYVDLAYTIPHAGNNAQVNNPGAWTAARYQRALATTWPDVAGAEYWLSLIFEAKATPTGNTYYIVKLYGNSTEVLAVGKGGGGTAYTCGSGWPGGGSADRSAFECTGAEPVWLVTRIVMSGDGNDERTFMWVNPDPSLEPDTSIADVKRNSTMDDGIDMIGLECGGEVAMETHWDEIVLADSWAALSPVTDVAPLPEGVPNQFTLSQNYPNPFNPSTRIAYTIHSRGPVQLKVYDVLGREVAVLMNGIQNAGKYEVSFSGAKLPSGIYFYKLVTAQGSFAKKMVLVK